MRQARLNARNSGAINFASVNNGDFSQYSNSFHMGLPSYEQSVFHLTDIPPPYEEAIKIKSVNDTTNNSSHQPSLVPIHSISLSVDQAATAASATNTSGEIPNRKRTAPILPSQSS